MHLFFKLHRTVNQYDPSKVEEVHYEKVTRHYPTDKYYVLIMEDKSAFIPLNWILEAGEIKDEPEEKEKCGACGQEIPEGKSSDNV